MFSDVTALASRHLLDRRGFLGNSTQALSGIACAALLAQQGLLRGAEDERPGTVSGKVPVHPEIDAAHPFADRPAHLPAAARRVLVIFCSGACSHLDTFDYKPELWKRHGQPMPGGDKLVTFQGEQGNLTRSPWQFRPRGRAGKMISDLVPQLGALSDQLCFLHSVKGKTNTHGPGENYMSTGFTLDGFPSVGAWTTYALGSENENLPAYVAIPDPRGVPQNSVNNWGPGFLPAAFQGTDFNTSKPIRNLSIPEGISAERDQRTRGFLRRLNERHLQRFPGDTELAARISSYELAASMQLSIPGITDISSESATTLRAYGADDAANSLKADYAKNCILARRLAERGVRFIQLFHRGWDQHYNLPSDLRLQCRDIDRPVAALLRDLKQRGMLDETLVVWGGEFGRTTYSQGKLEPTNYGRDHHGRCFSMWMAGGGIKAGVTYGETDDFSYNVARDPVHVHDLNATLLHLMGLNHEQLTYRHSGRDFRLTDVHGHVVRTILA